MNVKLVNSVLREFVSFFDSDRTDVEFFLSSELDEIFWVFLDDTGKAENFIFDVLFYLETGRARNEMMHEWRKERDLRGFARGLNLLRQGDYKDAEEQLRRLARSSIVRVGSRTRYLWEASLTNAELKAKEQI